MKTATVVLRHEHEAIVLALRLLAEIDRHAMAQQPVEKQDLQALVDFLSEFADTCHHGKEEQLLFAQMTQTGHPQVQQVIERLRPEHAQARHWIARMRHALQPFKPSNFHDAARSYAQLMLAHIDQENTVLFPWAEKLLSTEQLIGLSREFEAFEAHVIGAERHAALHDLLARLQTRYTI